MTKPYKAVFHHHGFLKYQWIVDEYTILHDKGDKVVFAHDFKGKRHKDVYKVVDIFHFPEENVILYSVDTKGIFEMKKLKLTQT